MQHQTLSDQTLTLTENFVWTNDIQSLRNIHTTFHVQHDTKITPAFLPTDGKASWSLNPSPFSLLSRLKRYSATQKDLLLYQQGDRLSLRKKAKKDKH